MDPKGLSEANIEISVEQFYKEVQSGDARGAID
jgi:hypothetical protein